MKLRFVLLLLTFVSTSGGALALSPEHPSSLASGATALDSISGVVTDSAGQPLGDARVTVVELGLAVATDANGRFRVAVTPGARLTLVVRRLGFTPVTRVLDAGSEPVTIRLAAVGVKLAPVTVTATRKAGQTLDSPLPTSELSEDDLRDHAGVSLAQAVADLPGVRALTTGAQIGKPVIRGLSGPRVLTLDNGSRLEDYSWSDEDGPAVDVRLTQRIEVIRGPASVLYGSDAIGGVINAIPLDLPDAQGGRGFYRTGLELTGATNNMELSSALRVEGATGKFGWRAFGVGRFAEDLNTPDGKLDNTGFAAFNGEGAVGMRTANGNATLRAVHQGGEFRLLEANGPPAGAEEEGGPVRKLEDDRLQLSANQFVRGMRVQTDLQWQRHGLAEVSDDISSPGGPTTETEVFNLVLNTVSADAMLHHDIGSRIHGTIGGSGLYQNNDSRGKLAVVPDARITGVALFLFEQAVAGPWSLLAGARADGRHLESDPNAELQLNGEARDWHAASGDVGLVFRPRAAIALAGNLGRAWRAPTLFELFANGPRLGEARYEIGDPNLDTERGTNLDASVRWESRLVRAEIAGFRQKVHGFVYITPTGEQRGGLPVYRYRQTSALLTGGEVAVEVRPVEILKVRAKHDFVRGDDEVNDQPLPLVPPPRSALEAELEFDRVAFFTEAHLGLEGERYAKQTRLSEFDEPTAQYMLMNLDAGGVHRFGSRDVRLDLLVRNLADTKYRSYTSRYKSFAYEPGRNIILRVSTGL